MEKSKNGLHNTSFVVYWIMDVCHTLLEIGMNFDSLEA